MGSCMVIAVALAGGVHFIKALLNRAGEADASSALRWAQAGSGLACLASALMLVALPTLVPPALAQPETIDLAPPPDQLQQQRQEYKKAMRMLRFGRLSRYQVLKPKLRNYALYPYLEFTEHERRLSRLSESDLLSFSQTYHDTPLAGQLFQVWLTYLAKKGQWERFLQHYDQATPSKPLACDYGYALHQTGRKAEMMQHTEKLWLVNFSQPAACDRVFKVWQDAKGLTQDLAWDRFSLALRSNQLRLANYLVYRLNRQNRRHAKRFLQVRRQPKTIKNIDTFSDDNARNREIILYGVQRLARQDPEAALSALNRHKEQHQFEPSQLEAAYVRIGVHLALLAPAKSKQTALPIQRQDHPALTEAQIRAALKLGDNDQVMALIELLPEQTQATPRWQYWKAKMQYRSGSPLRSSPQRRRAVKVLRKLATSRSFYGFVAADQLGVSYNFEDESRPASAKELLAMVKMPGILRALELFALKEHTQARREWHYSTKDFDGAQAAIAAQLALERNWYRAAIQMMSSNEAWNHLDVRFPLAFQPIFSAHADQANIPVPWSLAIARQESSFMPDAKSHAGALGIMQILPSTAKEVAKEIGTSFRHSRNLLDPATNIELGTAYLGKMFKRFDNNRILASVAYNAGAKRAREWYVPSLPFDVWIETIPNDQARNYVQNVLLFTSIYSRKFDRPLRVLEDHERKAFSQPRLVDGSAPAGTRKGEEG